MNDIYQSLFTPLPLNNGVTLNNRFAMAPMLVFASNQDGTVSQDDLYYFALRNRVGQLLISGAMAVSEGGLGMPRAAGCI